MNSENGVFQLTLNDVWRNKFYSNKPKRNFGVCMVVVMDLRSLDSIFAQGKSVRIFNLLMKRILRIAKSRIYNKIYLLDTDHGCDLPNVNGIELSMLLNGYGISFGVTGYSRCIEGYTSLLNALNEFLAPKKRKYISRSSFKY